MSFRALVLDETGGKVSASIRKVEERDLPAGDVTLRVEHSTLNYKDGMILKGIGRLVRRYPHIPGIDFVGTVEESTHPDWKTGDRAILTGWRVGEVHWGGYSERARVNGDWLVPLPEGLTPARAMAIGTAGFTAMLSVMSLEEHGLSPEKGEVLVTGASGGLGSAATAILAARGYAVAASTGREENHDYLRSLGAASVIDRSKLATQPDRPLLSERWAGCIDSVGGTTLATVLASMKYWSGVACCGLAGGNRLETTVIPFVIRGIRLLGIDSATCPAERRKAAWGRLVQELPADKLDAMTTHASLEELTQLADRILEGKVRGRIVIDIHP